MQTKTCFPPNIVFFVFIFECLPVFLLSLVWPSTCSISLSLPPSSSFLSFFLLVFLILLSLVPSFSLFIFSCRLCFCFMNKTTIKRLNCNLFSSILCLLWFPVLFSLWDPFLLSLFLLIFSYVFVEHQCFWFEKRNLKTTNFWSKGGVATKRLFFLITCVLQNVQVIVFCLPLFWSNFGCSKNATK